MAKGSQRAPTSPLAASLIDARRLPLRAEAVDVVTLSRHVVERTAAELSGRGRMEVSGAIPPVHADPFRFEEILVNLLSNAGKYSFPGTPIDVGIAARAGEVVVSVVNRGEGVSAEEMSRLFERFQRLERARRGEARGIGLGLYIATGLVEAHGGHIWAESVPGQTTTFSFSLPTHRDEPA